MRGVCDPRELVQRGSARFLSVGLGCCIGRVVTGEQSINCSEIIPSFMQTSKTFLVLNIQMCGLAIDRLCLCQNRRNIFLSVAPRD